MTSTRTTVNAARALDAQARMLADQKRRLGQRIAAGNPLAWAVYDAIYGDGDGDDFEPVEGPSLAAIYRQWLDRGLPASTWPTYLERMREASC